MEKIYKYLILSLLLAFLPFRSEAVQLGGNSRISLLTCAPGTEVWSNYGHTALRVYDPDSGLDVCFNYGLFSFDTPHFIWRFCTGATDYVVGAQDTDSFLSEYMYEGREVTEQVLNLDVSARNRIWEALCVNVQPQNRTYRYNFFYDNCATRVRRMIEDNCGFSIGYGSGTRFGTLREVVNHYTEDYPWTRFGVSLLLGSPADSPASLVTQMFAPEVMMDAFDGAQTPYGPLVSEKSRLIPGRESRSPQTSLPSPSLVLWLLFLVYASFNVIELRKGKRFRALDIIIWGITGLMGVVIGFLVFFSTHPATDPNFLLLWLNPLGLVFAIALCFRRFGKSRAADVVQIVFMPFVIAGLAGFLFIPQWFHPALIPLSLCLLSRCELSVINSLNRSGDRK